MPPDNRHQQFADDALYYLTDHPPCSTLQRMRGDRSRIDLLAEVKQFTGYEISLIHYSKFEQGWERPWKKARSSLALFFGMTELELFPEHGEIKRGRKYPPGYVAKRRKRTIVVSASNSADDRQSPYHQERLSDS